MFIAIYCCFSILQFGRIIAIIFHSKRRIILCFKVKCDIFIYGIKKVYKINKNHFEIDYNKWAIKVFKKPFSILNICGSFGAI
jgi:hypothetical protein